ncbi:MAG: hypothetical protein ACON4M_04290 [Crocinitomicaceae bacterium]
MKKLIIVAVALVLSYTGISQTYEYKVVTSVESIIPMGLGRSRIIENNQEMDYRTLTTSREKGNDSKSNQVKRKDAKIDGLNETKMLNFYSGVGINFRNIASNDALVTSMLNSLSEEGWDLFTVSTGVESDAGSDDGQGIFVTRYIFRRIKQ